MKKLFVIFLIFALFLPVYAQEAAQDAEQDASQDAAQNTAEEVPQNVPQDVPAETTSATVSEEAQLESDLQEHIDDIHATMEMTQTNDTASSDAPDSAAPVPPPPPERQKESDFGRQHFEIGFSAGAGFDNNLIRVSDILKKEIILDLNKLNSGIGDNGVNFNLSGPEEIFHVDVKNITIGTGVWAFGLFVNTDVGLNFNLPKSLITLVAEGNLNQRSIDDMISAKGAAFASAGLRTSAQYGKLKVGFAPSAFTPLVYVPKSGINFTMDSTDSLSVTVGGTENSISVYSPFIENGEIKIGVDFSVNGEYALFDFLDVGGSFVNIPLGGATLRNRMQLSIEEIEINTDGLLQGNSPDIPDFDFEEKYNSHEVKVFRPLRFDTYAHYRPLAHFAPGNKLLTVTPNLGFSVDLNGEPQAYFNAGLEAELNLMNMFKLHLGSGIEDAVWKQRAGFNLNFRAFELLMDFTFRSSNFADSFRGKGFGVNVGVNFGW